MISLYLSFSLIIIRCSIRFLLKATVLRVVTPAVSCQYFRHEKSSIGRSISFKNVLIYLNIFEILSSVSPGPLQDIVVPREVPRDIHREALSNDMDRLCDKLENVGTVEEVPYVDIFTRVMDDMAKSPKKGKGVIIIDNI